MAITVNIYYSGVNGNAGKFAKEMISSELLLIFVQKMEISDMNTFYQ